MHFYFSVLALRIEYVMSLSVGKFLIGGAIAPESAFASMSRQLCGKTLRKIALGFALPVADAISNSRSTGQKIKVRSRQVLAMPEHGPTIQDGMSVWEARSSIRDPA
jgi:hypothetical protein